MTDIVTLVYSSDLGPDSRAGRGATALAAAGYGVHVLALEAPGRSASEEPEGFSVTRLKPVRAGFDKRLAQIAVSLQPRVVHGHDMVGLELGTIVTWATGAKFVYDSQEVWSGFDAPVDRASREDVYRGELERECIGRADRVIAGSDSCADFLREQYGFSRVHVVRNIPRVEPAAWREDIRAAAGLEPHIRVLVHLGELNPSRGRSALLGAVAGLPDTALVVIAEGDSNTSLREAAEVAGVSARVVSLATRSTEEAVRLCADADIAVCLTLPVSESRRCSLPERLFEYAAAGIPILGSGIPEVERRIREYALGEVVDGDSPESVERGISRLLSEPDCREEAAAGGARLREYENRPLEARALVQIYRELCEPGSGVS